MPVIEVQAVGFVLPQIIPGAHNISLREGCHDGFIRWRTEMHEIGRSMAKAWMVVRGTEVDLTGDVISGKVRAARFDEMADL